MYEDDKDWVDSGEADMEAAEEVDDVLGGGGGMKGKGKLSVGLGMSKRMPVEREEIVRLVLQGLRDIGYK
jgi:hypothetical protein